LSEEYEDPESSIASKLNRQFMNNTLIRGKGSLVETLQAAHLSNYLDIYSLRTHGKIRGRPVTEQILIHSNICIVDDDVALISSGNTNDRSLLGSRDSELGIIIEDNFKVGSVLAGQQVMVSNFVHNLRTRLFMEHLNLSQEEVRDPMAPGLNAYMKERAQKNTNVFREIFRCTPDDNVAKFEQEKSFKDQSKLDQYDNLIQEVRGHLVQFSTKYGSEEHQKRADPAMLLMAT